MAQTQPISVDDWQTTIRFCGHDFMPLISGALYWPEIDALLVADLHFEKFSSFAPSGQFLPPYDTGMTLRRLEGDIDLTGARKVIALGDSFHRDNGVNTLQPQDRQRLSALTGALDWVWLAGNHDPAAHALGGHCAAQLAIADLTFQHEPRPGTKGLVAGHLHPAARIAMNGKSARRSCFAYDDNLMILPAYGASTGSLNILSPAFQGLFDKSALQVVMIGRDRTYPVGSSRLVAR